jgi:tripartite-type tricarboxylate transporter receptor subunit TctC
MKRYVIRSLTALVGAAAIVFSSSTPAQNFPDRALRMIVPFAPGGATDIIARLVADKLGGQLGQPVVVENRPGGGTLIGTRAVLQAPADGYTILMASSTLATAPLIYRNPGYKLDDFALVAPIGSVGFILSINADVPAKNLAEMVAYAKANPGKLNNGSLGGGGATQLLTERFKIAAGISLVDVNYSGGAPAMKDLIGGNIQVFLDGVTTTVPQLKSGRIRPVGITTERRSAMVPDIPTFKEQGFPTITGGVWFALYVSAKTPPAIVQKLAQDGQRAAGSAEVKEKLGTIGAEGWTGSVQDFATYVKQDLVLWEQDARRLNIQLD